MNIRLKQLLIFHLAALFSVSTLFSQSTSMEFRKLVNESEYEQASKIANQVLEENQKDYELILLVGDVYYELEEFSDALSAYSRAKKLRAKDERLYNKLAKTLVKLERPKEAVTELEEALDEKGNKGNVSLMLDLANAYIAAGNSKAAEVQITNARSIDNKNPEVFVMLGKLYYEQKIWELAKTNYEEALQLSPNNVEIRQLLAEVYWKLAVAADGGGDVELMNEYLNRSLEQCNTALKENDKDASTWRLKGQIHFNANQKLEAAQAYNKFLTLRPNNYKERWRLAELLATSGLCDSAYVHLDMVINSTHKDVSDSIKTRAKLLAASCHYNDKNYSESAKILKALHENKQLVPDDLTIYAISTLFLQDTANALVLFNELFEVAPEQSCSFMLLVANQILKPQKRYAEMIEVLKKRLGTSACSDNNDAFCYYTMGTGYFSLNDTAKAIETLKKAIEIQPEFYWAHIYLGDIYYSMKNMTESEAAFNLVIEAGKADPEKYKNELNAAFQKIASARLDGKKYADLEKIAKEWTSYINEENEYGHLFLAIAYQGQGKVEQAKSSYREVLKINKDNKTAKDNLRALGN